jgi:hypothetical protein
MTKTPDQLRIEARRELNNFRAVLRRKGTTGWVDRSAAGNFRGSFRAVLALEDVAGIDAAYNFGQRLDALRREAISAGLLTPSDVLSIEAEEANR